MNENHPLLFATFPQVRSIIVVQELFLVEVSCPKNSHPYKPCKKRKKRSVFEDLAAADARLERAEAAARKRVDGLRQDLAAADGRCGDLEAPERERERESALLPPWLSSFAVSSFLVIACSLRKRASRNT